MQRLLKRDRAAIPSLEADEEFRADEGRDNTSAASPSMSADAPTAAPAKLKPFSESNGASLLAKSGSGAKVVSPFSSSVGGTKASPFGGDFSQTRKPVAAPTSFDPEDMSVDEAPWWSFLQNVTMSQVVIVLSFTTIIALMIGTFNVVFSVGAVHFNDIDL